MRDLSGFLTKQEIYILEESRIRPYKDLAVELELTMSRIGAIKQRAEWKIRQEKRLEQDEPGNQASVTLTLQKKDLYVLDRALLEYITFMNKKHIAPLYPDDPQGDVDYDSCKKLRDILKNFFV